MAMDGAGDVQVSTVVDVHQTSVLVAHHEYQGQIPLWRSSHRSLIRRHSRTLL